MNSHQPLNINLCSVVEGKFLFGTMLVVSTVLSLLFISGTCAACDKKAILGITAPQRMEALSGSCVQIPCNFQAKPGNTFDVQGKISGVWIKRESRFALNPKNVVFNLSSSVNSYNISITGDLGQKNCTTLFPSVLMSYTDKYFFRIESKFFTATASCDPIHITVKESALSPTVDISGNLKENETITITCSALTPCPHSPPKLTWTLKNDSQNNMERNTDGTFSTKIQETIILTDEHDGNNITCSATYPVNEGKNSKAAEETKTLSVSYAPKSTNASISPSDVVSAGVYVNLTCSCRAKPPVSNFTWFKLSSGKPLKVSEGEVYSFSATEGGVYYCMAKNALGENGSPQIQLSIEGEQSFQLWWAAMGGLLGITGLICLVILIWWRRSKRSACQETQSVTAGGQTANEPSRALEREDIHYGEIDFSNLKTHPSSDTAQNMNTQQETVYAQVRVSKAEESFSQAADTEGLYAQVKRK